MCHECFAYMSICVPPASLLSAEARGKENPLELELQVVVSCHVSTVN